MAPLKTSGIVMLTEFTYTLPKNNFIFVFIGKMEMIEGCDIMNGSRSYIAHLYLNIKSSNFSFNVWPITLAFQ